MFTEKKRESHHLAFEIHRVSSFTGGLDPSPQTLVEPLHGEIQKTSLNLRVAIYPGCDGEFQFFDGTIFTWNEEQKQFSVSNSPVQRKVTFRLRDQPY